MPLCWLFAWMTGVSMCARDEGGWKGVCGTVAVDLPCIGLTEEAVDVIVVDAIVVEEDEGITEI